MDLLLPQNNEIKNKIFHDALSKSDARWDGKEEFFLYGHTCFSYIWFHLLLKEQYGKFVKWCTNSHHSGKDLQIRSFVMGFHEYWNVLTPHKNEVLLTRMEPTNKKDGFTVAVINDKDLMNKII